MKKLRQWQVDLKRFFSPFPSPFLLLLHYFSPLHLVFYSLMKFPFLILNCAPAQASQHQTRRRKINNSNLDGDVWCNKGKNLALDSFNFSLCVCIMPSCFDSILPHWLFSMIGYRSTPADVAQFNPRVIFIRHFCISKPTYFPLFPAFNCNHMIKQHVHQQNDSFYYKNIPFSHLSLFQLDRESKSQNLKE